MIRVLALVLLIAVPLALAANDTVGGPKPLFSDVSETQLDSVTGSHVSFMTFVRNQEPASVPPLFMYFSILDSSGNPIDLRGWVTDRLQHVGTACGPAPSNPCQQGLGGNSTQVQHWILNTPIAGDFVVYVISMEQQRNEQHVIVEPISTPALYLHVVSHPNVDPKGALPVVVGIPGVLFLASLARSIRRK